MAALMYSRRLSALLALPLMAVLMAAIGGISPVDIQKDVINAGVLKLHSAYAATMIGAVLAELINKQGIARALVRWVAEFAGDSPFILGLLMTLVSKATKLLPQFHLALTSDQRVAAFRTLQRS